MKTASSFFQPNKSRSIICFLNSRLLNKKVQCFGLSTVHNPLAFVAVTVTATTSSPVRLIVVFLIMYHSSSSARDP